MIQIDWKAGLQFESHTESGHHFVLDGYPEEGKASAGPTPMEMLLTSAAACSAMDVISILEKKRQKVDSYRIEVSGERSEEGVYPRPYTHIHIRHIVTGPDLDPVAVERAVQLSDEKYCSVVATLRAAPEVKSTWAIE